jgi:hypothetical protein
MSEQEPLEPEQQEDEELDINERIQSLQEGLTRDWESRELALTAERFADLVPKISAVDLTDHPIKQAFQLDYLLAIAERNGEIKVSQTEFAKLNDLQQCYVINHEFGHQLDWRLRQIDQPSYQQLIGQVAELPPEEVSYYVHWLDQKLEDSDEKAAKIGPERMAELFGQYLTSDGTFPGMIKMRLLQFNGDHEHWSKIPELEATLASLEEFHPEDEHEQMAFFQTHPELQAHYQIWQSLNSLCRNEELMAQATAQDNGGEAWADYDDEWLEYETLTSQMAFATKLHPEPLSRQTDAKQSTGLFAFLKPLLEITWK